MSKFLGMEKTFSIDLEGKETRQRYTGEFTYKRPNIRTKSDIAKLSARLNGGEGLDPEMRFLHEIIAHLKFTLVKAPQWWEDADSGFELYDTDVILEVYKKTQDFEKEYFENLYGKQDEVEISDDSEKE